MDVLEMIENYIVEDALILIAVLLVIGFLLRSTPKVPNWIIPWVLLGVGIALAIALLGFTADAIIQGVLVVGAAVLMNQLYKQTKKKE